MLKEAEDAVQAGLSDAEFRSLLQEKGLLVEQELFVADKQVQQAITADSHGIEAEDVACNVEIQDKDLFAFQEQGAALGTMTLQANAACNLNSDNYVTELLHILDAKIKVASPSLTVYVLGTSSLHVAFDGDLKWLKEGKRSPVSSRGRKVYIANRHLGVYTPSSLLSRAMLSFRVHGCIAVCRADGIYQKVEDQTHQLVFTKWQAAAVVIDELAMQLLEKTLMAFTLSMDQLCSTLDCTLYQKNLPTNNSEKRDETEDMSAALLGSGHGGRVYKVIVTDADGKQVLRALKIVGVNDGSYELRDKTKREFYYIRRIQAICPDHVLGVCGEAITEGSVTLSNDFLHTIKANHVKEELLGYESSYLGYLMPTVAEPIKGALSESEVFLILRSLFTLHCMKEYHGSARMDNAVYNTERGLYQWIDFRHHSQDSYCTGIEWDMHYFFGSLNRSHGARFLLKEFEICDFRMYKVHMNHKHFHLAWVCLEKKMSKIEFLSTFNKTIDC